MSFAEVRGHESAKEALRGWIRAGKIPHAVLLVGPEGIGKFRFAEAAARTLLCGRGGEEGCDRCPSCKKCRAGVHPDLLVVEPTGRGGSIGIDAIRGARRASGAELPPEEGSPGDRGEEIAPAGDPDRAGLLGWLSRKPLEGIRKCALVRDADRLTPEAVGSLLKTLEEPPPGVVLLLIAPSLVSLADTLVSRCRILRMAALDEEIVVRFLVEEEGATPEAARAAARAGDGSIAASIEAARGDASRMLVLLERLLSGEVPPLRVRDAVFEGLPSGAAASDRRTCVRTFFRCAAAVLRARWRDLVAGEGDAVYREERRPSLSRIERALEGLGEAFRDLDRYVDPGLLVDDFALVLAGGERPWSATRRSGTD